jgi:hypothetical protein
MLAALEGLLKEPNQFGGVGEFQPLPPLHEG